MKEGDFKVLSGIGVTSYMYMYPTDFTGAAWQTLESDLLMAYALSS